MLLAILYWIQRCMVEIAQNEKKVIMCVCRKYNYSRIREIVREEDHEAFFIVSNASEVFGDGYKDHFMEEI